MRVGSSDSRLCVRICHVIVLAWLSFFRWPKPYARFGVKNHTVKKSIALIFVASTLLLAGCCTTHQAKHWEYMQLGGLQSDASLNKFADEGWTIVSFTGTAGGPVEYLLKRPKQ